MDNNVDSNIVLPSSINIINMNTISNKQLLAQHAQYGNIEGVRRILRETPEINVNSALTAGLDTLLHVALQRGHIKLFDWLINSFFDSTVRVCFAQNNNNNGNENDQQNKIVLDVNAVNHEGMTPLMVAMISCKQKIRIASCLLERGADPTILSYHHCKTALDMIQEVPNNMFPNKQAVAKLLKEAMEKFTQQNEQKVVINPPLDHSNNKNDNNNNETTTGHLYCHFCNNKLKPKTSLHYLLEDLRRDDDDNKNKNNNENKNGEKNPYLSDFLSSSAPLLLLQSPHYHVLTAKHHIRKEITESWAILKEVECVIQNERRRQGMVATTTTMVTLIDLCAGSSLTTTLFGLRDSQNRAIAVDMLPERCAPHFQNLPQCQYIRADIQKDNFVEMLKHCILEQQQSQSPTDNNNNDNNNNDHVVILVGMHLCCELSERAIELFWQIPQIRHVILSPCCYPKHIALAHQDEFASYKAWTMYLCDRLGDDNDDRSSVHLEERIDRHILSNRNRIITASKKDS